MNKSQGGQMTEFAMGITREIASYPYILIRDHHRMGIDEKDLVTLLRILHPYFSCGSLTREDVAKEFGVTEDEARVIIMPFLEKGLLEENKKTKLITCGGIFDCYYEDWINSQRISGGSIAEERELLMPEKDRQLIKELAHIYRVFEQEMGRNLTPIQSEEIRSWMEKDDLSADMIEEALRRSVLQEKRTFAYIKSILRKWREAGYASLREVEENDRKPQTAAAVPRKANAAPKGKKSKYSEVYDKY